METERRRYPGPKPFSEKEAPIFRGREKDVERLLQTLGRYDQVLVFAKSGVGKSSLIQAGLRPILEANDWKIIKVRFYPYRPEGFKRPVDRVMEQLDGMGIGTKGSYLEKFQQPHDLWRRMKSAQTLSETQYLFVFDQLEELFTYPVEEILSFKRQVADLMYDSVPSRYLVELRKAETAKPGWLNATEKRLLYKKQHIKILGAIRDDSLHQVLQLADYLPDLQHNLFELKALDRGQALAAIVEPAENTEEQFATPAFGFTRDALDAILDFLTHGDKKSADSTLLQIICQDLEKKADRKEIGINDLPNFADLVREFYLGIVNAVPEVSPMAVRKFIEGRLIFGGRRVPIPENECEQALKTALKYLVDEHLLRAEQNSVGGFSYELCHDTLVEPITFLKEAREAEEAEENRRAEQQRFKDEMAAKEKAQEKDRRMLRRTRIFLFSAVAATLVATYLFIYAMKQAKVAEGEKEVAVRLQEVADSQRVAAVDAQSATEVAYKKILETQINQLLEKYKLVETLDRDAARYLVDSMWGLDKTNHEVQELHRKYYSQ